VLDKRVDGYTLRCNLLHFVHFWSYFNLFIIKIAIKAFEKGRNLEFRELKIIGRPGCASKIAASVLLKLFINGDENTTPLTPLAHELTLFSNINNIQTMIPKDLHNAVVRGDILQPPHTFEFVFHF